MMTEVVIMLSDAGYKAEAAKDWRFDCRDLLIGRSCHLIGLEAPLSPSRS